jgi:hypothetical protein
VRVRDTILGFFLLFLSDLVGLFGTNVGFYLVMCLEFGREKEVFWIGVRHDVGGTMFGSLFLLL